MSVLELRASCTGSHGTPPWYNIFHVHCAEADAITVSEALPPIFKDFYDALAGYLQEGTEWTLFERVTDIEADPPKVYFPTQKTSSPSGSGDPAPTQLAAVLSWHTEFAGPRYRGRTYIGPVGLEAIANAGVATGFQTAMKGAAAQLMDDVASILVTDPVSPYLCVHSQFGLDTEITGYVTGPRWRTQRRRN